MKLYLNSMRSEFLESSFRFVSTNCKYMNEYYVRVFDENHIQFFQTDRNKKQKKKKSIENLNV